VITKLVHKLLQLHLLTYSVTKMVKGKACRQRKVIITLKLEIICSHRNFRILIVSFK